MPVSEGIYYTISGRGTCSFPPVILIHGAGSDFRIWPTDMRRLTRYQIIALDLPGHGRSEGTACHSIEAYTERLLAFLHSLKVVKAVLVGHDMGGAIALTAALHPAGVAAGVGLISSGAFLGGESDILTELSAPFGLSNALQLIQKKSFSPQAKPEAVKDVMQGLSKVRYGVLYNDWRACARFDLRSEALQVKAPLWAAVGDEDAVTPPGYARYLVDKLPDAALQIISGAGHMLPAENGTELVLGLRAFLERIEFRRRTAGIFDTFLNDEYSGSENFRGSRG
jgi:pimeloyl-ACP methyl ester carboxylesterase